MVRTGRAYLWRALPEVLARAEEAVSPRMFRLMQSIVQQWRSLEAQIAELEVEILRVAEADPACQRLQTVPGVGPLAATAIVAAVGNGMAFQKGREFSAWLGLVPHQRSAGGQTKLLGISKRGNEYLRRLFIHGARSVCLHVNRTRHAWGEWITELKNRKPSNLATVALANKLARIAWSVLNRNEVYRGQADVIAATA